MEQQRPSTIQLVVLYMFNKCKNNNVHVHTCTSLAFPTLVHYRYTCINKNFNSLSPFLSLSLSLSLFLSFSLSLFLSLSPSLVAKQVNRTKSWSSVTTATPSVSSSSSSVPPVSMNSNTSSSSTSSGGGSNSKNWQEVSRAIK